MGFYQTKQILNTYLLTFLLLIPFFLLNCSENHPSADMVMINGNIITVDNQNTITEAIAVSSDTIMLLGTNNKINDLINENTVVIDLKGKTAIPGFIDSHAHLIGTGKAQINLNLRDAQNWDEVVYLVTQAADKAKNGEWIIGRGWHQEKWSPSPIENINGYPLHNKLSEATPDNPVLLSHASGHAVFANANAMSLAKITSETPDPRGGKIIRDIEGKPVGVFMEEAEKLISDEYNKFIKSKTSKEQVQDKKRAISLAIEECLSKGITTLHDAGATFDDIKVIREMVDSNQIKIRLYEMLLENYQALKDSIRDYQTVGYGSNHLTVRAIKLYMDGALGSRGAWLLSPYEDSPGQSGLNITPLSEIRNIAELAAEHDFQICTHAIGDKANRLTLDFYEDIFNEYNQYDNFRWRVEHSQHLNSIDIPRFAELDVIASMQSIHCTSDAPFVEKRLGKERAKTGAYVWQSLIESGAIICNGTDSPVEGLCPLENFYTAITRKTKEGNSFYPDQKMNRLEALKTYTINGAYASFEENIKGSLEIGKLADITVLSKDILSVSEDEILNTNVIYTIVGGKILFER